MSIDEVLQTGELQNRFYVFFFFLLSDSKLYLFSIIATKYLVKCRGFTLAMVS